MRTLLIKRMALAVTVLNCMAFPLLAAQNKPPVANNDSFSASANTTLTVAAPGVLANDTDQNGDPLTAVLASNVSHGALTFNANGSFTYTPTNNFTGTDSFIYQASDGQALSGNAAVTITVNPSNHPPVVNNDSYSVEEDHPLTVAAPGVLANDADQDGDPLTAVLGSGVDHGTLVFALNGSFTYTPETNFFGTDSFTYRAQDSKGAFSGPATVSIIVNPVNDPPVARDANFLVPFNSPFGFKVFVLISDPDPDPFAFRIVQFPAHGTLTVNSPNVTYTPNPNFLGNDSFTFVANDGQLDSNVATVGLHVVPVFSIDDISVPESAGVATFTVTLSTASTESIQLGWQTFGISASEGIDYVAASGTLTFAPGDTNKTISISIIQDTVVESAEVFDLLFNSFVNATPSLSGDVGRFGQCTILDDDSLPVASINNVSVQEGNSSLLPHAALFTINLSPPSTQTVTVNWATHDGTAVAPGDYASGSGTLTFSPGVTNQFVRIVITPDTRFELDETFSVQLSSPVNAILGGTGIGTGTILNDDTRIGVTEGIPPESLVKVGERFTYGVKWTHPVRWRLLDTVDIRIIDDEDSVLNVRFDETANTFSLFDPAKGKFLHPDAPGSRTHFETSAAAMYLENSQVIGSGPTGPSVLLNLNLSFKPKAANRVFRVEAFATDDFGNQQGFDEAGIIAVLRK